MMSTLDILPTFAKLAGARIPDNLILDGFDQSDLLTGKTEKSAREIFYYHVKGELQAVRHGKWKLLLPDRTMSFPYTKDPPVTTPELYDLENDISEKINLAGKFPEIVSRLIDLSKKVPEDLNLFTL